MVYPFYIRLLIHKLGKNKTKQYNTFILILQQLCKLIIFIHIKWQNVNQNFICLLCFSLQNNHLTLRFEHCIKACHRQFNALHEHVILWAMNFHMLIKVRAICLKSESRLECSKPMKLWESVSNSDEVCIVIWITHLYFLEVFRVLSFGANTLNSFFN